VTGDKSQPREVLYGDDHYSQILAVGGDYADFTVPSPFSSRVRNALSAEAKSARLSALVGAGGIW
jgi:hypothetical protein